jgi:PAP2 superfamily/Vanadium chloroperoxidase N-terminal domain
MHRGSASHEKVTGRGPGAWLLLFGLFTAVLLGVLASSGAVMPDEVLEWNTVALEVVAAGGQNAVVMSRSLAMTHLAMHDALNAIDRRYEPYLYEGRAEGGALPEAAVAAAARDVLIGALAGFGSPEQRAKAQERADGAYAVAMAKIPDGPGKQSGLVLGGQVARAMVDLRKADGASATVAYSPGTAPGQWRPHPNPVPPNPPIADPKLAPGNWPAMLPQWAQLTPFTMRSPWQFRLPGPPALTSEAYARDYNEVKQLGGKQSTARTDAQSEIARYWYEPSPPGWNRIARTVAAQRALDPWEHARLLALLHAAMADGFIAGWDTRYLYNLWRPATAIRAGDEDGNPATAPDPAWETYLNTPAIPDYPSTHSVLGAAAAAVLGRFFGSDQLSFAMTSGPPFPGIARSFKSFGQAAQENADSRIYAGIHFRSACQDGIKLGEQIGRQTFAQLLQPYRR